MMQSITIQSVECQFQPKGGGYFDKFILEIVLGVVKRRVVFFVLVAEEKESSRTKLGVVSEVFTCLEWKTALAGLLLPQIVAGHPKHMFRLSFGIVVFARNYLSVVNFEPLFLYFL